MSEIDLSQPYQREVNVGIIAGGCDFEFPLQDPFCLWDTRNWDGLFKLYNEGTAGSVMDLHVLAVSASDDDIVPPSGDPDRPYGDQFDLPEFVFAHKRKNWGGSQSIDIGDEWPTIAGDGSAAWGFFGGDPCDAPFTWMIALADESAVLAAAEESGDTSPNVFHDTENIWGNWLSAGITYLFGFFFGSHDGFLGNPNIQIDNDAADAGGNNSFMEIGWNIDSGEQYGTDPDSGSSDSVMDPEDPSRIWINNRIITLTMDPLCQTGDVWVGTHRLHRYHWEYDDPVEFTGIYANDLANSTCLPLNQSNSWEDKMWHGIVGHVNSVYGPKPGYPWNTIIGTAWFRGTPTVADIQFWEDYFYPPGQVQPPGPHAFHCFRSTADITSTGDPFLDDVLAFTVVPKIEEFTVPVRDAPFEITRAMFRCVHARGANPETNGRLTRFELACQGGDVIRVELGGVGGTSQSATLTPPRPVGYAGVGGWPDGGDGGTNVHPNAYPGSRGGGGGGSTRIYLNGGLIAILGGLGGSSLNVDDNFSASSRDGGGRAPQWHDPDGNEASFSGLRIGDGQGQDLNGTLIGGKGATSSAPGAGGVGNSGTGSPGVGAQGGNGANTNVDLGNTSYMVTGGGGGGLFGGGGGGVANVAGNWEVGGGGAGTNWFDHSVISRLSNTGYQNSDISPFNLPGVDIYLD